MAQTKAAHLRVFQDRKALTQPSPVGRWVPEIEVRGVSAHGRAVEGFDHHADPLI